MQNQSQKASFQYLMAFWSYGGKTLRGSAPPPGLDRVNRGAEREAQLQNSLGTPISGSSVRTFLKRDNRRMKKSQKAADTKEKKKEQ